MNPHVLGISASPVADSNTEKDLHRILGYTGLDSEFVRLADCDVTEWEGCPSFSGTESCRYREDGRELAMTFRRAPAFVLAAFTSHRGLDALSRAMLARVSCEKGGKGPLRAKVGAAIITSPCVPGSELVPPFATAAARQIVSWMRREGIHNAGVMLLLGNASCLRCAQRGGCDSNRVAAFQDLEDAAEPPVWRSSEEPTARLSYALDVGQAIRLAVLDHTRHTPTTNPKPVIPQHH